MHGARYIAQIIFLGDLPFPGSDNQISRLLYLSIPYRNRRYVSFMGSVTGQLKNPVTNLHSKASHPPSSHSRSIIAIHLFRLQATLHQHNPVPHPLENPVWDTIRSLPKIQQQWGEREPGPRVLARIGGFQRPQLCALRHQQRRRDGVYVRQRR